MHAIKYGQVFFICTYRKLLTYIHTNHVCKTFRKTQQTFVVNGNMGEGKGQPELLIGTLRYWKYLDRGNHIQTVTNLLIMVLINGSKPCNAGCVCSPRYYALSIGRTDCQSLMINADLFWSWKVIAVPDQDWSVLAVGHLSSRMIYIELAMVSLLSYRYNKVVSIFRLQEI